MSELESSQETLASLNKRCTRDFDALLVDETDETLRESDEQV